MFIISPDTHGYPLLITLNPHRFLRINCTTKGNVLPQWYLNNNVFNPGGYHSIDGTTTVSFININVTLPLEKTYVKCGNGTAFSNILNIIAIQGSENARLNYDFRLIIAHI